VEHLGEAEDALVVGDPVVHPTELDVADSVVELREEAKLVPALDRRETRQERSPIGAAFDEGVDGLAVRGDRGEPDKAVLVLELVGLVDAGGAPLERRPVGGRGVGHRERERAHAVAVRGHVCRDGARADEGRGQDEPHVSVLHDAGGAVAHAGLEPGRGDLAEAEGSDEVVGRLGRIPDPELEVVEAEQRHRVGRRGLGLHLCRHRGSRLLPTLVE
jgi:hypothetical protein